MIRMIMRRYRGCIQIPWNLPYSWGKHGKTSASRPSMKAVRPVIASNGAPYLQMRSLVSYSTSWREREGKKERSGWIVWFPNNWCFLNINKDLRTVLAIHFNKGAFSVNRRFNGWARVNGSYSVYISFQNRIHTVFLGTAKIFIPCLENRLKT